MEHLPTHVSNLYFAFPLPHLLNQEVERKKFLPIFFVVALILGSAEPVKPMLAWFKPPTILSLSAFQNPPDVVPVSRKIDRAGNLPVPFEVFLFPFFVCLKTLACWNGEQSIKHPMGISKKKKKKKVDGS